MKSRLLRASFPIFALTMVIVTGCTLAGRGDSPEIVPATPVRIVTVTPRTPPTDSSVPTPTPVTNLNQADAELMVWNRIESCANSVASASESILEAVFDTSFDQETEVWTIIASAQSETLNFGQWEVLDLTGQSVPIDSVAKIISTPRIVCGPPKAVLTGNLTPPIFSNQVSSSGLEPVTEDQARVRVWIAVRSCHDPLPLIESFTAYQDRPGRWIIEGRTVAPANLGGNVINYGLWAVDEATGEVFPHDEAARNTVDRGDCYQAP